MIATSDNWDFGTPVTTPEQLKPIVAYVQRQGRFQQTCKFPTEVQNAEYLDEVKDED